MWKWLVILAVVSGVFLQTVPVNAVTSSDVTITATGYVIPLPVADGNLIGVGLILKDVILK